MGTNDNAIYDAIEQENIGEIDLDELEEKLEAQLDEQLGDLSFLEEERKKIGNPQELGKIVIDEVWSQFANQIGLDMTNETLIQAYNKEHPEVYSKEIGDEILKDPAYKEANNAMREKKEAGELVDAYTGKKLGASDKANLDHVEPRKELFDNQRRRQAGIDTKDLANKEENLAPTNESLNKSKKEKSNKEYVETRKEREEELKKQNAKQHEKIEVSDKSNVEKQLEHDKIDKRLQDKLDADDQLMMEADKKARKAINHDITVGVAKQTAKKAGKDALKMMAVTALFDLLKAIMNGLVRFFREKQKSFDSFLQEIKTALHNFLSHIMSFVKTGASSAIGTVVIEIFGPVVSLFKKLASFLRQGVSTLGEAITYLSKKENKDKPISIKIAQVGKIITAGLVAAGAIIGGELFEKVLLQIPVMAVEIPLLGSLANITGMLIASILSGAIGAVVINLIDRYIAKKQLSDNQIAQIDKKNEILEKHSELTSVKIEKLKQTKRTSGQDIIERHFEAEDEREKIKDKIFEDNGKSEAEEKLKKISDNLDILQL